MFAGCEVSHAPGLGELVERCAGLYGEVGRVAPATTCLPK